MALFDRKQVAELKKGLNACNACEELTRALRQMGAPNEMLEEQNAANRKIIETALRLDEEHSREAKG